MHKVGPVRLSNAWAVASSVDEMAEMREHSEQAALFNLGAEEAGTAEEPTGDHLGD